jgi:hypothetical protein
MTTYTIHATKDGETVTTVRIGPTITVAKARTLLKEGWNVRVTDGEGHQYGPGRLDRLLSFDRRGPIRF